MDKNKPAKVVRKEAYFSLGYSPVVCRCPNCKNGVNKVTHEEMCNCGQKLDWK